MPPVMRDVYSSHVNKIGHDPAVNELHVQWDTGKTSIYSDVSAEKADEVMSAWSVGKALTEQVKSTHPHRYVK